jgi:hypothetical protein
MDSHRVILRIDECLRTPSSDGRRRQLLEICRENLNVTGGHLFNAFRGHLDMMTLHGLVSAWDNWRSALTVRRSAVPKRVASRPRMRTSRRAMLVGAD